MPNKQISRTRKQPKSATKSGPTGAAPATWAAGGRQTELKSFFFNGSNYQLYHNVAAPYTNVTNMLDNITLGTQPYQRVGARIFLRHFECVLVLNNKTDRPNVSYRFVVVAAPTNTNTDTFSEMFSGAGFTSIHVPNNSLLLHDSIFPINQGSGMENNVTPNKERSFTHRVSFPINKPVTVNTNDGAFSTRLVAFVVAYDAYGTLTTDNIASVAQTSYRIMFTDQ